MEYWMPKPAARGLAGSRAPPVVVRQLDGTTLALRPGAFLVGVVWPGCPDPTAPVSDRPGIRTQNVRMERQLLFVSGVEVCSPSSSHADGKLGAGGSVGYVVGADLDPLGAGHVAPGRLTCDLGPVVDIDVPDDGAVLGRGGEQVGLGGQ